MLYLLWSLLNIGLFLFFIMICFKATKFIREKIGLLASIVFVFGLLSFVGKSNEDKNYHKTNSSKIKTWSFISEDILTANEGYFLNISLEKTIMSKYELGIRYGKEKQTKANIPISAFSTTSGIVSGSEWTPTTIIVNKTDDNHRFEYFVEGLLEWNLLGLTIYTQLKEYKGVALIK